MLVTALAPRSVVYVDRDWLPGSSGDVPYLVADPERGLAWSGGRPVRMPGTVDSDTAAALALLAVAQAAVAAATGVTSNAIEVTGRGLIALQVRFLLAGSTSEAGPSRPLERPRAIIDTTGDPTVIVDATRRTADLGTVVFVGESLGRTVEMNLYPDVHLRGLTLVGVPPPLRHPRPRFAEINADDHLVTSSLEALVDATAGTPLLPGAKWYRISG